MMSAYYRVTLSNEQYATMMVALAVARVYANSGGLPERAEALMEHCSTTFDLVLIDDANPSAEPAEPENCAHGSDRDKWQDCSRGHADCYQAVCGVCFKVTWRDCDGPAVLVESEPEEVAK